MIAKRDSTSEQQLELGSTVANHVPSRTRRICSTDWERWVRQGARSALEEVVTTSCLPWQDQDCDVVIAIVEKGVEDGMG